MLKWKIRELIQDGLDDYWQAGKHWSFKENRKQRKHREAADKARDEAFSIIDGLIDQIADMEQRTSYHEAVIAAWDSNASTSLDLAQKYLDKYKAELEVSKVLRSELGRMTRLLKLSRALNDCRPRSCW